MTIPNPWPAGALDRFMAASLYAPEAFLIDAVHRAEDATIEAECDTRRALPIAALQRGDPARHPRHVSGPELVLLTGNLGMLHAWFFYGCHFDEGWVGFGSRIHRADFKFLARLGPPLALRSTETQRRVGDRRVVLRLEFEFSQGGRAVYRGDQTAIFVRDAELADG